MNATAFQNILEANSMISIENLELPPDWMFQQDNDLKHTAKSVNKITC